MKRILLSLIVTITALAGLSVHAEDTPIITIHSNAYNVVGETNQFSILLGSTRKEYFDIDMGAGLNEIEIDVANIDTQTGEWSGTWIPCRVNADGCIKVYGDASLIDVIVIDGAYVTDIDMTQCTNLEILSLEHNALQRLDLTPFNKLVAIYLTDNPFTPETPLVVGPNKPALQILELDIIDYISPDFNLSDYPAIMSFDGYHSTGITSIDPTGCPDLRVLSLEMTAVSSLDVSQNPNLMRLNISETRITDIDLTHNASLQHLLAGHTSASINTGYHLNSIDLSGNPILTLLDLTNNALESIDLSHNPLLTNLTLSRNKLTSLDLSANTELYSVDLQYNDLDFATLPLPQPTWGEYFYLENSMRVNRSIGIGTPLDLSSKVLRDGTTTTVKVYSRPYDNEPVEVESTEYSYSNGVITFKSAPTDSVTVYFYNDTFNEYPLATTAMKVKDPSEIGQPSVIASLVIADGNAEPVRFAVGLENATAASPRIFTVRYPGGQLKEFSSTFAEDPSEPNVILTPFTSGRYDILINEGDVMTSLYVEGVTLYEANVTKATELRKLHLNGCGLYTVDLRYNRCLTELDLSHNNLFMVDLTGIYGNYEKNVLTDIRASHNNLSEFTVYATRNVRKLDLSHNALTAYDLTNFDNLDVLDLSYNSLGDDFSLAYLGNASSINLSHNTIESLLIDSFSRLESFDVSSNNLTTATLPLPSDMPAGYIYAPQNAYHIYDKAPAINLSSLAVDIDGNVNTYVWKKLDGTPLKETDYVRSGDGFQFDDTSIGTIYCEVTNAGLPQLTGENVFRTTPVTIVGAPTKVVATFTTTENSTDGSVVFAGAKSTSLYIDWHGDGTEFRPYTVESTYIAYPDQQTYAGATVKVYTYDSPEDITVFSINGIKMADFDASALTKVKSLNVNGAGLSQDKIVYPETETITEIALTGNELTEYPFYGRYPNLIYLVLTDNKLTSFDASKIPSLGNLFLAKNQITDLTFDNPRMWNLELTGNGLEAVSLEGLPSLEQLFLNDNNLTSLDLTPVRNSIVVLSVTGNRFTFATLPRVADTSSLAIYNYQSQQPVEVECNDGKVDLSAQAMVDDVETVYTWYIGEVYEDTENEGALTGEALIRGEEYTVENGVTTFLESMYDKVTCVMTNSKYTGLNLVTVPLTVTLSSLDEILAGDPAARVDVYDLSGVLLRKGVEAAGCLDGLRPGIYIVNGKKILHTK